ncbi:MAG: STAS domain-containing protein [Clostridia bacterium]|nr:STAS domain-containing protein [Clostridia bacterium]
MTIEKKLEGNKLAVSIKGRLDTMTSPELEAALHPDVDTVSEVRLDLTELEYISSAGLRVLLSLQKTMNGRGSLVLSNPNADIREIFDITGFSDILTIE